MVKIGIKAKLVAALDAGGVELTMVKIGIKAKPSPGCGAYSSSLPWSKLESRQSQIAALQRDGLSLPWSKLESRQSVPVQRHVYESAYHGQNWNQGKAMTRAGMRRTKLTMVKIGIKAKHVAVRERVVVQLTMVKIGIKAKPRQRWRGRRRSLPWSKLESRQSWESVPSRSRLSLPWEKLESRQSPAGGVDAAVGSLPWSKLESRQSVLKGEVVVRFLFVEKPVIARTPPCRPAATSPLPEGGARRAR